MVPVNSTNGSKISSRGTRRRRLCRPRWVSRAVNRLRRRGRLQAPDNMQTVYSRTGVFFALMGQYPIVTEARNICGHRGFADVTEGAR